MTAGTAGTAWVAGGELKTLRRIVGGSAEEDEDVPAAIGHNHTPQAAVHESTGPEIALEEQAQVVERVLVEAEGRAEVAGRELLRLRARFCEVETGRRARILRLRAEGMRTVEIAAEIGVSRGTVIFGNYILDYLDPK
jgi:DNA-binding NarL/FixJ family response regulator